MLQSLLRFLRHPRSKSRHRLKEKDSKLFSTGTKYKPVYSNVKSINSIKVVSVSILALDLKMNKTRKVMDIINKYKS